MAKQTLQGQAPSAAELAWLKHGQEEQQKAPERIEEAAKYLSGIIAICLTIFLDKRPTALAAGMDNYLLFAAILWAVAALLSLGVFIPWRYRYIQDSPDSIKAAFQRVLRVKFLVLLGSIALFMLGFGVAIYAIFSV